MKALVFIEKVNDKYHVYQSTYDNLILLTRLNTWNAAEDYALGYGKLYRPEWNTVSS